MFFKKAKLARPSLAQTLADAVRTWWHQDDIRVSPYEGRLLRLDVPCIVEVEGDLFEITRRAVLQTVAGKYVSYYGQATADDTPCEFECRPGSRTVRWRDAGGTRSIDERSIGVFCPTAIKDRQPAT